MSGICSFVVGAFTLFSYSAVTALHYFEPTLKLFPPSETMPWVPLYNGLVNAGFSEYWMRVLHQHPGEWKRYWYTGVFAGFTIGTFFALVGRKRFKSVWQQVYHVFLNVILYVVIYVLFIYGFELILCPITPMRHQKIPEKDLPPTLHLKGTIVQ
jgi:hypothetical protein